MSAMFRLNNEESGLYPLKVGVYHNKFQNRDILRDRNKTGIKSRETESNYHNENLKTNAKIIN